MTERIISHAFRLKPGEDLKAGIEKAVWRHGVQAGWIAACAGSLTAYAIRFAGQPGAATCTGHFEIVSLTGTVSVSGLHLHISISDGNGNTIGGHLAAGCIIYTTAEIVMMATDKYLFAREQDGTTPWKELQVKDNNKLD